MVSYGSVTLLLKYIHIMHVWHFLKMVFTTLDHNVKKNEVLQIVQKVKLIWLKYVYGKKSKHKETKCYKQK